MSDGKKRLDEKEEAVTKETEEIERINQLKASLSEQLSSKKKGNAELDAQLVAKEKKVAFLKKRLQEKIKESRDMRKTLKQKTLAKNGDGVILDVDGRMFLKNKIEDVLKIVESSQLKGKIIYVV